MGTFVNIMQHDIEEFLGPQGFQRVRVDGVRELVYGKRVDQGGMVLTLRVYTGIEPGGGQSRAAGSDAIRCVLVWRKPSGEVAMVSGSKRVHRVAGWRDNLQQRLDTIAVGSQCDKCGAPMVLRQGRNGDFYGCASYPECRNTKQAP